MVSLWMRLQRHYVLSLHHATRELQVGTMQRLPSIKCETHHTCYSQNGTLHQTYYQNAHHIQQPPRNTIKYKVSLLFQSDLLPVFRPYNTSDTILSRFTGSLSCKSLQKCTISHMSSTLSAIAN